MTLDSAVNTLGSTLLHISVSRNNEALTKELLKYGAKTYLTNVRGDRPYQRFIFPHCNKADGLDAFPATTLFVGARFRPSPHPPTILKFSTRLVKDKLYKQSIQI